MMSVEAMSGTVVNPSVEASAVPQAKMRIGSEWRVCQDFDEVREPFAKRSVAQIPRSSSADLNDALEAAVAAKAQAAEMPAYERAAMLNRAAEGMTGRAEKLARTLAFETGKALKDSRIEVARSIETLRFSAAEAIRIEGEHVPLDGSSLGAGKIAML